MRLRELKGKDLLRKLKGEDNDHVLESLTGSKIERDKGRFYVLSQFAKFAIGKSIMDFP